MGRLPAMAVLLVGGALIALAVIGFVASREEPGRDIHLRLAGGGDVVKGTLARVRSTTGDGRTREAEQRVRGQEEGGAILRLPLADATALTEVALVLDGQVLWQVPPFLDTPPPPPANGAEPPAPQILIADPAALLPLIGNLLDCGDGPVREVGIEREPGSAVLTAELDGQVHPLRASGQGWEAGGIGLIPKDGLLHLQGADGETALCTPRIPGELRPLRLSGPDWTLVLHGEAIGWAEAGKPPVLLQPSGTLSEWTDFAWGKPRQLDRITFRTMGFHAFDITATAAPCAAEKFGRLHAWRVEIRVADGSPHLACAGGSAYPETGLYRLDNLNGSPVAIVAELSLQGPSFTARSVCFSYEGRVTNTDEGVRLELDRRELLADCTGSGRRMAGELDEALKAGALLSLRGEGGITLRADIPDKGIIASTAPFINGQLQGLGN